MRYVFMEVSSHAIHQHRIAGLQFAGAMFSNITHDHLDYHKTFDEYIRVKNRGSTDFHLLPLPSAMQMTNGCRNAAEYNGKKHFYSLKTMADFKTRYWRMVCLAYTWW